VYRWGGNTFTRPMEEGGGGSVGSVENRQGTGESFNRAGAEMRAMEQRLGQKGISMEIRLGDSLDGISETIQTNGVASRKRAKSLEAKLGCCLEAIEGKLEVVTHSLGVVSGALQEADGDSITIYRELSMVESIMEGVVASEMRKVVAGLRADFKRILDYMSKGTPVVRGKRGSEGEPSSYSESDAEVEEGLSGEVRRHLKRGELELRKARLNNPPAVSRGHGRRVGTRGGGGKENPIIIDSPNESKKQSRKTPSNCKRQSRRRQQ